MGSNTAQDERQNDRYRLEVLADVAGQILQAYFLREDLYRGVNTIGIYASCYLDERVLETIKDFIESRGRNPFRGIHCKILNSQGLGESGENIAERYDIMPYLDRALLGLK